MDTDIWILANVNIASNRSRMIQVDEPKLVVLINKNIRRSDIAVRKQRILDMQLHLRDCISMKGLGGHQSPGPCAPVPYDLEACLS